MDLIYLCRIKISLFLVRRWTELIKATLFHPNVGRAHVVTLNVLRSISIIWNSGVFCSIMDG